ncbi:hypothetical protein ABPG73_021213, partial [Tetrahymena malaccensis]
NQSCLQCSNECQTCFNTQSSSCITCNQNLFKNSNNGSACVQKCQMNEFLNENKECVKCLVFGCIKCDDSQKCLQCDLNLKLDLANNQCIIMDNVCPYLKNFIQGEPNLKKCQKECSLAFYQNMEAQTCEETIQCTQIKDSQRLTFDQRVIEIQQINLEQYLIAANGCTFALVDINWNIINVQVMQSLDNFEDLYIVNGEENLRKSFIVGDNGGCSAASRLLVVDFKTLQVVFQQNNTNYDYFIQYVDSVNQIVFFGSTYGDNIMWYDAINRSISHQIFGTIKLFFFGYIETIQSFLIQSGDSIFQIANLKQNRSIEFKSINQKNLDGQYFLKVQQYNDYHILFSYQEDQNFKISKIMIEQDIISMLQIIVQYLEVYTMQKLVYYSEILNSIIQQNQQNLNLELLMLNKQSDQIIERINLTSSQLNSFQLFEDKDSNSTLAFIFSENLQIVNITNILVFQNNSQKESILQQFQPLNYSFINQQSIIVNFKVFKNLNTVDFFISQVLSQFSAFRQFIRFRYNLNDNKYQIKYLTPYQFKNLYQYGMSSLNQNQKAISKQITNNKNQIYVFDGEQGFVNQTIGVVIIQEYVSGYQVFPKMSTKVLKLNQIESTSQETYKFVALINNKYILLQQNILIVKNIPQIFNLNNTEQQINDGFDLQTFQNTQLFNFDQSSITLFWTIELFSNYPLIISDTIIYFCDNNEFQFCQPFSLIEMNFIMKITELQLLPLYNPIATYQKTKEIFMFYYDNILVYSYDLQNLTQLNLGYQYPSSSIQQNPIIFQNDRFVFYSDQAYLYKFDMELKQFQVIEAATYSIYQIQEQINFYYINNKSYVKKSGNIIDIDNMIIIKSQEEDNSIIGQIQMDGIELHIFQSQNGVYWYKNLLNTPFKVVNFTSSQIFQDLYFTDSNNLIALYDISCKCVQIYDMIKNNELVKVSQANIESDLIIPIKILDWFETSFVYVQGAIINIFNSKLNQQSKQIAQLESNITEYQYCSQQQIIVVKTQNQSLYRIKVLTGVQLQLNTKFIFVGNQNILKLKFTLQCTENLLIIYSPLLKIIDLDSGNDQGYFQNYYYQFSYNQNYLQNIPIINTQEQLLICFFDTQMNYFQRNNFSGLFTLFDYRQNNTNIYYDLKYNILIGVTGMTKQINIINIPGDQILFTYNTINSFLQGAAYHFLDDASIILVDSTPIIYLCRYSQRNITTFNTFIKDTQGIQMEQNKQIIFLYSYQFIYALKFPDMQLIETFSLHKYNQTNILGIFINSLISILTVQTSTAFISFDLTEVLYASETNLLQYQKIQNIYLNENYQVYYSLSNLSLNLFKNTQIVDTLLLEPFKYNIYPYFTEPILISENQFIYITYNQFRLIQVNTQNDTITEIFKTTLQNTPYNYFYDKIQNQIVLLYQQNLRLYAISFNNITQSEVFLTNLQEIYISQSIICSQYIVMASINIIQIYNIQNNLIDIIELPNQGQIKLFFKLIIIQSENEFWKTPFQNYDRINSKDQIKEGQSLENIFVLQQNSIGYTIFVVDLVNKKVNQQQSIKEYSVMNVVSDPFKQLIYLVSNQASTNIYSYTLEFLTSIQNPCLKQAIISYDANYIYSICPNDIIIYNRISFQQQFKTINQGISEANNIINMNYNNFIIIVQKQKLSVLQLSYSDNYQIIYEYYKQNLLIQSFQLINDSYNQAYASLIVTNYETVSQIQLPLSKNKLCSIQIQQKNRISENIYTKTFLDQLTFFLNTTDQMLSLIEIEYLEGQIISQIDISVQIENIQPQHPISLRLFSQNMIYFQQLSIVALSQIQITISNCNLVVIDQLFLQEIQMQDQFLFVLSNNTNVIINEVYISDLSAYSLFQITYSEQLTIQNINIENCSHLLNIFDIKQIKNLTILNTFLNQNSFSHIYLIQSTIISSIQNILIQNCTKSVIIQIEEQEINTVQYLSDNFMLNNVTLLNCVDTLFSFNTQTVQLSNIALDFVEVSQIIFSIQANQIGLENLNITNTKPFFSGVGSKLINIISFTNCFIKNINSFNNEISIISINQQKVEGYALISQSKFINFTILNNNPLIFLNLLQKIELENVLIKNVINTQNLYTSLFVIQNCDTVTISDSQFINNTNSNGPGGVIYATENRMIRILNTKFHLNQCITLNGGAIYMLNLIQLGILQLDQIQLIGNKALFSSGGAIYLQNNNLIMTNSVVSSNLAQIGGGIYYTQIVPDFIIDLQNGNKNNNTFKDNLGQIYGQNYGSTLRKLSIDLDNIEASNTILKSNQYQNILIKQFKSGDQIHFKKIQLLDEEENPMRQIDYNSTKFNQMSNDVQAFLEKISVQINWDQENQQIQCIGQLQTKSFMNGGFNLNVQIFYKPISNMILKIVSNIFPQINDSSGNAVVIGGQIELNIQLFLDQCSVGEIAKYYGNSIACESCPDGKYSLNQNDDDCKQCPDSAIRCIGSNIYLKNGYWRKNEYTDNIFYCSLNPLSCKPQYPTSKFNCDIGYKGPLCQSCDTYGEIWETSYSEILNLGTCYKCQESKHLIIVYNLSIIFFIFCYILTILKRIITQLEAKLAGYFLNKLEIIYLGSTLSQLDRSQILSKILTDHLQILSLVCTFSISMPLSFTLPIQLSGNPASLTSKSIDCIFSKYPNLQPLWLFQSLWSFTLPIGISLLYILTGFIFIAFKINMFLVYLRTAAIFIYFYFFPMVITLASRSLNCLTIGDIKYLDLDLNVQCFDKHQHMPFVFYYSIPIILIWGYKERFYFWEFWKLFCKTNVIIVSVLFKQNINAKMKSLLKVRKLKQRVRQLIKQHKTLDLNSQESLQKYFNSNKLQDLNPSPKLTQTTQIISSEAADEKQFIFKNNNSIKRMRNKWSYYTRNSKINQISFKDKVSSQYSSFANSYLKDDYIQETESSIQNKNIQL